MIAVNNHIVIPLFFFFSAKFALCQNPLVSPLPNPVWENGIDFGCCTQVSPIDLGQSFAGPNFVLWNSKLYLFKESMNNKLPIPSPQWLLSETIDLLGKMISAGIDRVRLKWRDDKFWVKSNTKIYQQEKIDRKNNKWLFYANVDKEFNDFDIDIRGNLILIGTWDTKRGKSGALLESFNPNSKETKVIANFPDPLPDAPIPDSAGLLAIKLHLGYESVQIQEFIILFNPVARRVFIYRASNYKFKEIDMHLPVRTYKDLEWKNLQAPAKLQDLCWQVIPKGPTEAWVIVPSLAKEPGALTARAAIDKTPSYIAFPLNLLEGEVGEAIPIEIKGFPFFSDTTGQLRLVEDAIRSYKLPESAVDKQSKTHEIVKNRD